MLKAIHFYCRLTASGPENFTVRGPGTGVLGWWAIPEADARELIGGWAYLHHPSTKPSYGAYRVTNIVPASDAQWAGRFGSELMKVPEVKDVPWPAGNFAGQNPTQNYRIVDVDARCEGAA